MCVLCVVRVVLDECDDTFSTWKKWCEWQEEDCRYLEDQSDLSRCWTYRLADVIFGDLRKATALLLLRLQNKIWPAFKGLARRD